MQNPRFYRDMVTSTGLVSFTVVEEETDLRISTTFEMSRQAHLLVQKYRKDLKSFISGHPFFTASLEPVAVPDEAPDIVKEMARAGSIAGVGPMAAVAGAIAEFVGESLSAKSPEVIVENGGDIYLKSNRARRVAIYAGDSPLSNKIGLEFGPGEAPVGICTSSATVGPSLNFGNTDATVVVARSSTLADAAATAIGNSVGSLQEIDKGIALARQIDGLNGVLIIIGEKVGVWGKLTLCHL
jgi:ApbE superfamily uncharacterized protein (UPF0280 family)